MLMVMDITGTYILIQELVIILHMGGMAALSLLVMTTIHIPL